MLVHFIMKNHTVRALHCRGVLIDPQGALSILHTLLWNLSQGNLVLESLSLDDVKLTSFEGLGMIPLDILEQGTNATIAYILDLYRSPEADPVYRSKIMVVGFEAVGKTTILDCLFPMEGLFTSRALGILKTDNYYVLQGNVLSRFKGTSSATTPDRIIELENRQWEVSANPAKSLVITLTPKRKGAEEIELNCPDRDTCEAWLTRLRRVCMNEATHGIEIHSLKIDNNVTREYFEHRSGKGKGKRTLDLSVWDFAGQDGYYNNHHYFLTTRTVFMVLYRLDAGPDKAREGLRFWLKSLASHLGVQPLQGGSVDQAAVPTLNETYFSIIVVGTFLDQQSVKRDEKAARASEVDALAKECGLSESPPQYFEVSCKDLENIDILQEAIIKTAVSHTYMGERVPQSYLRIQEYVQRLREKKKDLPLVPIEELSKEVGNLDLAQRALGLLALWGECVYFDSPPELASVVILDPRFLTKGILADLFNHDHNTKGMLKDGVVKHSALVHIWSRFKQRETTAEEFDSLCKTFMSILEKLGVCFVVAEDRRWHTPFMEQRSIIPALLPEKPKDPLLRDPAYPSRFQQAWPPEPPSNRPVQVERVLRFTVLPSELVSRLLVRVHPHIQEGLVWKNEVVISREQENTQALIRVESAESRIVILVRDIDTQGCLKLLHFITSQVREVVGQGETPVKWDECVRSPHDPSCDLPLQDIEADSTKDLADRRLLCPGTGLPISAELLLIAAGQHVSAPQERGPAWWDLSPKQGASAGGSKDRRLLFRPVAKLHPKDKQPTILDRDAYSKFELLYRFLGGDPAQVTRVYAIDNPRLRSAFQAQRFAYSSQDQGAAAYRAGPTGEPGDREKAAASLRHLAEVVSQFRSQFNDGSKSFVVPVVQGTSETAAAKIAKGGFLPSTALSDAPYGQGAYLTTRLVSAAPIARKESSAPQAGRVFVVALALPGHAYPVTQADGSSLAGGQARRGYQSHYHSVDDGNTTASDDLVVFEENQTLPLFVVYTGEFTKIAPSNAPQWAFLDKGEAVQLEALAVDAEDLQEVSSLEYDSDRWPKDPRDPRSVRRENEELRALIQATNEKMRKLEDENVAQGRQISNLTKDVEELKKAIAQMQKK